MRILLCLFLLSFIGCSSVKEENIVVKPKVEIVDTTPSWDGNEQNSGLIDVIPGKGVLITSRAAKRYNALIVKYGKMFEPALKENDGLTPDGDSYLLDNEHLVKFIEMNRKHKNS